MSRKIIAVSNLGYSPLQLKSDQNYLLLGYFQTYRFAQIPEVFTKLSQLIVAKPSAELMNYIAMAKQARPTIIHIRLGDYKNEARFGIAPQDYYERALSLIHSKKSLGECWLFSDEPETAFKYFKDFEGLNLKIIPEVNNSAAETLELMRHGENYVIGNSSFSWWAAFLSYSKNKLVIAPTPWFADIEEPLDLIPPEWTRLPITHI